MDHQLEEIYYPMHPCTEKEFSRFNPASNRSSKKMDNYQEDGYLMCLDWRAANFELYGTWRVDTDYAAVDVVIMPCGSRYVAYDGTIHGGGDDCVWDK